MTDSRQAPCGSTGESARVCCAGGRAVAHRSMPVMCAMCRHVPPQPGCCHPQLGCNSAATCRRHKLSKEAKKSSGNLDGLPSPSAPVGAGPACTAALPLLVAQPLQRRPALLPAAPPPTPASVQRSTCLSRPPASSPLHPPSLQPRCPSSRCPPRSRSTLTARRPPSAPQTPPPHTSTSKTSSCWQCGSWARVLCRAATPCAVCAWSGGWPAGLLP